MGKPPRAWVGVARRPGIVLGCGQRGLAVTGSVPWRVRASGGGAVLRGPWLLWAALRLPRTHACLQDGPGAAARWFGQLHRDWLQAQGIQGTEVHAGPARAHWACFGSIGPGEVLVDGRKLVGIAQRWRRSDVLLSAGTLLADVPWPLLCAALAQPPEAAAALAAGTTTAEECLGHHVDAGAWAGALAGRLMAAVR